MYKDCIRVAASFCGLAKNILDCMSDEVIVEKVRAENPEIRFI